LVVYPYVADNWSGPVWSCPHRVTKAVTGSHMGGQGLAEPSSPVCGHTWLAQSHDHHAQLPLTALVAAAMAVPGTGAPLAGSTPDSSAQRPSPASEAATVSLSLSRSSAAAGPRVGASWHAASRNCSRRDTTRAAGGHPFHPCRAWRGIVNLTASFCTGAARRGILVPWTPLLG